MISNQHSEDLNAQQEKINAFLNEQTLQLEMPEKPLSNQLTAAIHYAVMNGGKRIRPLLVFAAAKAIDPNVSQNILNPIAAAVEYIHCYSLVHDDLPAMDDDDIRRGKPTCHKQFDEATAILVGDALQAQAYQLLINTELDSDTRIQLLNVLTQASATNGLVGGQAIDLAATNKKVDLQQLREMHLLKTGALIRASVKLGAIAAGANEEQIQALDDFALSIGLAFQVQDDILDIESSTAVLGKTQGSDIDRNKSTYPSLLGLEAAKSHLHELSDTAFDALMPFHEHAQTLRELAQFIIKRRH